MPRFFVSPGTVEESFLLPDEAAAHVRVLRMRPGDELTVCENDGLDHLCRIESIGGKEVGIKRLSTEPGNAEARVACSVFAAYQKGDRLEFLVQKATELGAHEIVCFPSARCVSKPEGKEGKKLERLGRIAKSAAEQSGRSRIPAVRALPSFPAALDDASRSDCALFCYEEEHERSLRAVLDSRRFSSAAIMTGPEGGFTEEEAEAARAAGLIPVSLGRRILRCETAPLCALSALMYHCGEY